MALVIEAADWTQSSSNVSSTSLSVSHAAYADGDLVLVCLAYWQDNNNTTDVTAPSGPNGETFTVIDSNYGHGTINADTNNMFLGWFIGDGAASAGSMTFTSNDATRFDAGVCVVPAGEFDATTPVSSSDGQTTGAGSSPTVPAFTTGSDDSGGKIIAWITLDQDPISGLPTGYTTMINSDSGRVSHYIGARDTAAGNSESVSSFTVTANDHYTSWHFTLREAASADTLLANDIESASSVGSPAVGQEHALLANDVSSLSSVSAPAISEENALLANDVESASEVTAPNVGESNVLLANDLESASEVTTPNIGQEHAILANDLNSASEVGTPNLSEENTLLANDVESASSVGTPALLQVQPLLANDIESASSVGTPAVGQEHALLANDLQSVSEVPTPQIGQTHVMLASDVESASEVTTPVLAVEGEDVLLANDISSVSTVGQPSLGQEHGLLANDNDSASEVSRPAIDAGKVIPDSVLYKPTKVPRHFWSHM